MMREVVVTADGRLLASRGDEAMVRFLDARTGRELSSVPVEPHEGEPGMLRFSPDAKWLAIVEGQNVTLVAPDRSKPITTEKHSEKIKEVIWSPTGRRLASVSGRDVWIWEPRQEAEATRVSMAAEVMSVVWSPDGETLAITSGKDRDDEGTLAILDARTREVTRLVHQRTPEVAFSSDGREIAAAGIDGIARVWDVRSGRETARLSHPDLVGISFGASGRRLVTRTDVEATIWNLSEPPWMVRLAESKSHRGLGGAPSRVLDQQFDAFSLNGRLFVSFGASEIGVWEVTSGREVAKVARQGSERALALSGDAKVLAIADERAGVILWDLTETPRAQKGKAIAASAGGAYLVSISGDGRRVVWRPAGRGSDRSLRVADADEPSVELQVPLNARDAIRSIRLSPDGRHLAVESQQGSLQLVEITAQRSAAISAGGGQDHVGAFAFSADGGRLAWGDSRGRVWIREVSGDAPIRLEGVGGVGRIAVSPAGRHVVGVSPGTFGGSDTVIRVWAADSGRQIARLPPLPVHAATIDSDSRSVLVALDTPSDLAIARYPLSAEDLIIQACGLLQRNLSRDEWEQYFHEEPYRKTCPTLP